jgi:hypothetical protein
MLSVGTRIQNCRNNYYEFFKQKEFFVELIASQLILFAISDLKLFHRKLKVDRVVRV